MFIKANEEFSRYGGMQKGHFCHREQIEKYAIIKVLVLGKRCGKVQVFGISWEQDEEG